MTMQECLDGMSESVSRSQMHNVAAYYAVDSLGKELEHYHF